MSESLVEKLKGQLDQDDWEGLKDHHERGALVVVHPDLDLVEVAASVAEDKVDIVQGWLQSRMIYKTDDNFVAEIENNPTRSYNFLIIQPYVLIQEQAN